VPVGGKRVIELRVLNDEAVGVGGNFDDAGAMEGEVFKADVLQRADADAEVVVATCFEVRLVVELELADVGDASQRDVVDGTVERGAVAESFHAGKQADGIGAVLFIGCSGDVLDGEVMNGAERDGVLPPIPRGERNGIVVRVAADVADYAIARGAIDMHAIPPVTIQRDAIDSELLRVAEMHGEGLALPHANVSQSNSAGVMQQDDTVSAGHGIQFGGRTAHVAVRSFVTRRKRRPDAQAAEPQ